MPTTQRPIAPRPSTASLESVVLVATEVASFDYPVAAANGPDGAFYVIGQLGPVWRVVDPATGTVDDTLVLDLSDRTSVLEAASSERGLLGVAFHPIDGRMYIHFTDRDGNNVVASWSVVDGVADMASERIVFESNQPGPGHNGGGMAFAADGTLFVGIGDGGASSGNDARDLTNVLGTVIRIVPRPDGPGYDLPADNPFVDGIGPDGGAAAPEIWAFGFRNPWKLFLDEPTGELWVADVGNSTTEELNMIPADGGGRDYGWNAYEGTRAVRNRPTFDLVEPVHEWGRDVGYASIGGVVYRGDGIEELDGAVVFGDLSGTVMLLGADDGVVVQRPGVAGLVSLHQGPRGELIGLLIWGEMVLFNRS